MQLPTCTDVNQYDIMFDFRDIKTSLDNLLNISLLNQNNVSAGGSGVAIASNGSTSGDSTHSYNQSQSN